MIGIDVHSHLEYMKSPESVIQEARKKMCAFVTSVADPEHFDKMIELRDKNKDFVFIAAGIHPTRVTKYSQEDIEKYIKKIKENKNKIVAIGETGMDYHHIEDEEGRKGSEELFLKFIELANDLKKPLVIHARNCMPNVLDVLKNASVDVVMHFFSGNKEELKECLDRGYYISFTTMLCKSKKYLKLAKKTPIDKMLLETDSPWLDPFSSSDVESIFDLTNRPWNIVESAKALAKKMDLSEKEILEKTTENAKRVFNI